MNKADLIDKIAKDAKISKTAPARRWTRWSTA